MKKHSVKPILSNFANLVFAKAIYPTVEYQKDNLKSDSYIFAPNHTNNLDGYLIWSLLNKDFDCDTFMYKEFWDNYPLLAKFLPLFNVYPISRDKVVLSEIKQELKKLKDNKHSLIIFPQGRHVDPEVMLNLKEEHSKTIPLGAFYFSALSSKSIIPIYMEPQQKFKRNVMIYGQPIKSLKLTKNNQNLKIMADEWLTEINRLYVLSQQLENRQLHAYKIHERYFDASGLHNNLKDPNIIVKYLDEINKLKQLGQKTNSDDIYLLGKQLGIEKNILQEISDVKEIYDKYLIKK